MDLSLKIKAKMEKADSRKLPLTNTPRYLFGGNKQKMKEPSSDEFDLQYKSYINNQGDKPVTYDNTIVTDIKTHERIKYIDKKGKGKYHVPFEGINLDEKAAQIGSGIIK